PEAREARGTSVRALAEAAYGALEAAIDRWPGPFAVHTLAHAEAPPGLGSRAALIAREALALLDERRRRAARRQRPTEEAPSSFDASWLLVQIVALARERLLVSAAAPRPLPAGGLDLSPWPGGDAPVAIDRAPPSRAYQKLEEAFAWLGRAPRAGETCVDLGAAPGGWTATLLKRGPRAALRAAGAPPAGRVGARQRLQLHAPRAGRLAGLGRGLRAAPQPCALRPLAVGRPLPQPRRHREVQGAGRLRRARRAAAPPGQGSTGLRARQAARPQPERGHGHGL